MRKLLPLFTVITLLVGGYFGYQELSAHQANAAPGKKQGGAVPVEAAKVREDELVVTLNTVGSLRANESLTIRPEVAGRVETIHFDEGSTVKKGEMLIALDDRVTAAELKQAEAALNLAQVSFKRAKLLKEKGAGTVSNYDVTAASLAAAQAQVELAKAKLDKMHLTAPFDGTVGLRHVSPGDYVNIGQDIASFQSISPMKVDFALPEKASRYIAKGQSIEVTVDAFPDRAFKGTVYAVDPKIDEQNRSILLRAEIPNEDGILQPGFFARISLIVDNRPNALFVPEAALMPSGGDNAVFLVGDDNKVTTRTVRVGERKNGEVVIEDGLAAGDVVITAGHLKLRDGAEVSYKLAGEQP